MFLSQRFNPFDQLDRTFNSFWDDDFSDFFSTIRIPQTRRVSKEELLKRKLNQLHEQENEINHYLKQYESQIEELKKNKQLVEKQKSERMQHPPLIVTPNQPYGQFGVTINGGCYILQSEINEQITQIIEEQKKQLENNQSQQSDNKKNKQSENRIFKKVHYISDGMEIEEQYDSTNPKNCFKIIRKQGEAPQIISNEKQKTQIEQNKNEEQQKDERQKLGNGLDEKLDQLCKMSGKSASELEGFVVENKDLTIGQLYDKANEQKLI